MSPHRRQDVGRLGEQLACAELERRGHRILERNFRTREGELDLVAEIDGALVFCEVKTLVRRSGANNNGLGPLESIRHAKRVKVRRMATSWLSARPKHSRRYARLRFDAIGVVVTPAGELLELEHIPAAF